MTYQLVWNSEVVDEFDTRKEAEAMAVEYRMALKGAVSIVERPSQ